VKPRGCTRPEDSELPSHKCPWIQTKANAAIKSVFNSMVPCAAPLAAGGWGGHGDGGDMGLAAGGRAVVPCSPARL